MEQVRVTSERSTTMRVEKIERHTERYIVKHMNNGDIGVYDTHKACFPVAGPELRAIGVQRADWYRGELGEHEARRIADALNALDQGTTPVRSRKAGRTAEKAADEGSLQDLADALIAEQVGA